MRDRKDRVERRERGSARERERSMEHNTAEAKVQRESILLASSDRAESRISVESESFVRRRRNDESRKEFCEEDQSSG